MLCVQEFSVLLELIKDIAGGLVRRLAYFVYERAVNMVGKGLSV